MSYLDQQFAYAKAQGWLPAFAQAAKDYDLPEALLMAIASRETNMRNIVGDGGHGYGLMQIDIRSFPEWVSSGAWHYAAQVIEKGAQVLDQKLTQIRAGVGKSLHIGGTSFIGHPFSSQEDELRCATAAYNAGLWPFYCHSTGKPIDSMTTGHNYSTDVWQRRALFEALLRDSPNG